jgi:dihydroorotate dehydrogenase electron transfer subunit
MTAPFGRRLLPVSDSGTAGAYTVLTIADARGPRPEPGQFYMLAAAERWGGGEDERPFLPRAFSHMRVHANNDLDFVLHEVGPGTRRLAELDAGDAVWVLGPLGRGFRRARHGRRPILVGGGVGIAPITTLADELGPAAPELLGFRDAAHAAVAELVPGARVATDDGSAGHHGRSPSSSRARASPPTTARPVTTGW